MEQIKNYVEALFLSLPKSRDIVQMKLDMLECLEDKYQALLDEGKNENEAVGLVLATVGSGDDLRRELGLSEAAPEQTADAPLPLSPEQTETLMQAKRHWSHQIAVAVALFILAPAVFLLLDDIIGTIGFFTLIAIGVVICILANTHYESCKELTAPMYQPKEEHPDTSLAGLFAGVSFPIAAVIYLCMGFWAGLWHPGWIIFVFCAALTGAVATYEEWSKARSSKK